MWWSARVCDVERKSCGGKIEGIGRAMGINAREVDLMVVWGLEK